MKGLPQELSNRDKLINKATHNRGAQLCAPVVCSFGSYEISLPKFGATKSRLLPKGQLQQLVKGDRDRRRKACNAHSQPRTLPLSYSD